MSPERPPLYSYRNGNGEWAPAPFAPAPFERTRDDAPLRIDIKFPVLGFLMDAELTGYDLKRRFQESVGFFYRVSDGSLYPALKKLARDKLVTMRTERNGKRARKLYAITPAGRGHFLKMLAEPSPPVFVHDEAQVKIYFGHHNPATALEHMRRMREFDQMWSQSCARLMGEMNARGENPFRKVLMKIGYQLTAFKAQMMAKLEVEMARELAMPAGGRTSNVHKPMRPATAKR
jgi:DNA-binding PadR family transcriptional regulator